METEEYDVVVIGGGPAGENAAQYAVEGTGMTSAVIEHELLGGECSYWACIPSKALLRPVAVADVTTDLTGVSTAQVEPKELLARRAYWVSDYDDSGQVSWADGAGIAVLRGAGRLTGERTIRVTSEEGDRSVRARRAVVIATGSEATVPEMYADALPWTSRDATGVVEVPDRLAVVGGGVVACEAAIWMAALGSQVTLLVRGDRLLARTEPFAGDAVLTSLGRRGVTVRFGAEVSGVRRAEPVPSGVGRIHGGVVTLSTSVGEVEADEVLLAIGRSPRLDDIGLGSVGLTPDDVTGGRMPDWLHAVGDASGGPPLTHWGKHQARVVGARIAAGAADEVAWEPDREAPVPQVVFTDPEVASVGLTEAEARDGRPRRRRLPGAQLGRRRHRPAARPRRGRVAAGRRRRHPAAGRRDLRRPGGRRAGPCGDGGHRRRGPGARAAARGGVVPHRQRALAPDAGGPAAGAPHASAGAGRCVSHLPECRSVAGVPLGGGSRPPRTAQPGVSRARAGSARSAAR